MHILIHIGTGTLIQEVAAIIFAIQLGAVNANRIGCSSVSLHGTSSIVPLDADVTVYNVKSK